MKSIEMNNDDFKKVTAIVQKYFDGLHYGDVDILASIFHQDAWLKAPDSRRSVKEWLANVDSRPVPAAQGRSFEFKILSIDLVQDQAMVKIHCPLFDFN